MYHLEIFLNTLKHNFALNGWMTNSTSALFDKYIIYRVHRITNTLSNEYIV